MKCELHPLGDGVGVCALCLSKRLLALAAEGKREPSPPPTIPVPRSVSPYVPRTAAGSRRSSIFSIFFRHHGPHDHDEKPQRSSSWLSDLLHGRRKKKKTTTPGQLYSDDASAAPGRDRDMPPEICGGECNTEPPCGPWHRKPSPMRWTTAEHHHHRQHGGGLGGFSMCFGPLAASGELPMAALEPCHRRRASAGGSVLCRSRSRKLAEFGYC